MNHPIEYKQYRIDFVYQNLSADDAEEIKKLWLENQLMPEGEANKRVNQVVLIARNEANEIVAVNTVYLQDFIKPGNTYYFYRQFIRPEDRNASGLLSFMTGQARKHLKDFDNPHGQVQGVVIVSENAKLARKGAHKLLTDKGWNYYGKGPRGFDVWYVNFDGSKMTAETPQVH